MGVEGTSQVFPLQAAAVLLSVQHVMFRTRTCTPLRSLDYGVLLIRRRMELDIALLQVLRLRLLLKGESYAGIEMAPL